MTKKKNVKTENVAENIEKENVVDSVSEIETLQLTHSFF